MNNPETLTALYTPDTGRRQIKQNTRPENKDEQHGHHQKPDVNPGTRDAYAVPVSNKDTCFHSEIQSVFM